MRNIYLAVLIQIIQSCPPYSDSEIKSQYIYRTTSVVKDANGEYKVTPKKTVYDFKVDRRVLKVGAMLVS